MLTGKAEAKHGDQMAGGETNSTKHMPLVSIITSFYNTEFYLAECIESVREQPKGS